MQESKDVLLLIKNWLKSVYFDFQNAHKNVDFAIERSKIPFNVANVEISKPMEYRINQLRRLHKYPKEYYDRRYQLEDRLISELVSIVENVYGDIISNVFKNSVSRVSKDYFLLFDKLDKDEFVDKVNHEMITSMDRIVTDYTVKQGIENSVKEYFKNCDRNLYKFGILHFVKELFETIPNEDITVEYIMDLIAYEVGGLSIRDQNLFYVFSHNLKNNGVDLDNLRKVFSELVWDDELSMTTLINMLSMNTWQNYKNKKVIEGIDFINFYSLL